MITVNGKEFRNLVEQVAKNQEDIKKHYEIEQTLADWGIKVIARQDTWEPPTGSFAFGDAIAVGPEGGPFDFYIWTRRSDLDTEGYWFNYGPISIVGPQGPEGKQGERGEPGPAGRWYVGPSEPTGDVHEGDMWLKMNSDNTTNGFVFQYLNSGWTLFTSILGPRGFQGPEGKQGPRGIQGPIGPQGPQGNPSPVINIIAELPEGTVISDIYNPSGVASNSGVLMPVGGVNHLWIIINGRWIDSGSWGQGGTRVYVRGEEVVEFNADTKVSAQTPGYNAIYGVGQTGTPFMAKLAPQGIREGNSVPRYGPGGQLETANPQSAYQCANKKYVDETIARSVAAMHNEVQHGNVIWTSSSDTITTKLGIGVFAQELLEQFPGPWQISDFVEWGGTLCFEGFGGYVFVNNTWHWNDAVVSILELRFDTQEATISSRYGHGDSTRTTLATLIINEAELDTNNNLLLEMTPSTGLGGGAFTFNSIPS